MRKTDDKFRALRTQLAGPSAHRFHLVEYLEAVVDASVQEAAKWIGDADEADAVDQRCRLNPLDRREVREQQRVARGTRLLSEDLRSVKQPDGVADRGHLAPGGREHAVHRHTVGEIGQPHCLVLDIAGVDVDDAVRRLLADPLDERRDSR